MVSKESKKHPAWLKSAATSDPKQMTRDTCNPVDDDTWVKRF